MKVFWGKGKIDGRVMNEERRRREAEKAREVERHRKGERETANGIISVIYGSQRCAKLNVPRDPVLAIISEPEIGEAINVLTAICR